MAVAVAARRSALYAVQRLWQPGDNPQRRFFRGTASTTSH
ncbi:hypothetical protein [Azospirillum largimobile]